MGYDHGYAGFSEECVNDVLAESFLERRVIFEALLQSNGDR